LFEKELLLPYDNVKNKLMAAKGNTLPKSMMMNVEVTSLRSAFMNTIQNSGFASLWSGKQFVHFPRSITQKQAKFSKTCWFHSLDDN
jgi:hypothetical protein